MLLGAGVDAAQFVGPLRDAPRFTAERGWDAAADAILDWVTRRPWDPYQQLRGRAAPRWLPARHWSSERFVGREAELWALHARLLAGKTSILSARAAAVVQIRGLGGCGKSLLALEYANRFQAAWPGGVFLLDGRDDLGTQIASLSRLVAGSRDGRTPADPQALARQDDRHLWIVDNLPPGLPGAEVERWLAPGPGGVTLVTTRGRQLSASVPTVNLGALSEAEALRLLRGPSALAGEEEEQARELTRAVGGHPLAVDVLRALVERDREAGRARPCHRWVQRLQAEGRDALEDADELVQSDVFLTTRSHSVTEMLRAELTALPVQAWDVLRVCAALADAPLPRTVIERTLVEVDGVKEAEAEAEAEDRVDAGVDALLRGSLVEIVEGGALVVPALIRRAVVREGADERAKRISEAVPLALAEGLGDVVKGHPN